MTTEQAIKLLRKETSISEIHKLKDKGLSHKEVTDVIQDAMDMGAYAIQQLWEGVTSHSERDIVECCVKLMRNMWKEFIDYLDYMGVEYDKDDMPSFSLTYFYIVQTLLLSRTHHSGGTSTIQKCKELGLDWGETIEFKIDEEGVVND